MRIEVEHTKDYVGVRGFDNGYKSPSSTFDQRQAHTLGEGGATLLEADQMGLKSVRPVTSDVTVYLTLAVQPMTSLSPEAYHIACLGSQSDRLAPTEHEDPETS